MTKLGGGHPTRTSSPLSTTETNPRSTISSFKRETRVDASGRGEANGQFQPGLNPWPCRQTAVFPWAGGPISQAFRCPPHRESDSCLDLCRPLFLWSPHNAQKAQWWHWDTLRAWTLKLLPSGKNSNNKKQQ